MEAIRGALAALVAAGLAVGLMMGGGGGSAGATQERAVTAVPLESLPTYSQSKATARISASFTGQFRGRHLARGLQLQRDGAFVQFQLGKHYDELFGKVYADDTNTTLPRTVSFTDSSNPKAGKKLFTIPLQPREYAAFRIRVSGVDVLRLSQSSCPGCYVPSDIVATVVSGSPSTHKKRGSQ
jgi:hypothetical protein